MSQARPALLYLLQRSTRNRITAQIARVRQPRYAVAMVVAVAYFALVFGSRSGAPSIPAGAAGQASEGVVAIGTILIAVYLMVSWLFRAQASGMAFTPAEVQFLLPGPLNRRELLGYRILRSQVVLLLNALVWSFLLRRYSVTLPWAMRFCGAWGLFSILSLHGMLTDIARIEPLRGIRAVLFRAMQGVAVVVLGVIAWSVIFFVRSLSSTRFSDIAPRLRDTMAHGMLHDVLVPFTWVIAPLHQATVEQWLTAFAVVLLIVAVHIVLILAPRVDIADSATAASTRLADTKARVQAMRSGTTFIAADKKAGRSWLPLAPTGSPALAIAWKNGTGFVRSQLTRPLLIMLIIGGAIAKIAGGESHEPMAVFFVCASLAGMLFIVGPRFIRIDLRQDLVHLAALRTYPISATALVTGELIAPVVVLSLFQLIMLAAGAVLAGPSIITEAGGITPVILGTVAAVAVIFTVNGMSIAIQNASALMFPAWVRIGADSGGIEAMGQTMMVMIGSLIALALSLVLPVALGVGIGSGAHLLMNTQMVASVTAGAVVAMILLSFEIVVLVRYLARVFERTDPTQLI